MTDEARRAFVAAHPRGFYWVRDHDRQREPRPGSQLADPFVAFFTGDESALWSYPGDDPRQGRGQPFDRPTVIMRVQEPAEAGEARRLDALVLKMWTSQHLLEPALGWPPGVGPGGMTMLSAYGRQMVCPGDPDDILAVLIASGYEAGLKREGDSSWSVVLIRSKVQAPESASAARSAR